MIPLYTCVPLPLSWWLAVVQVSTQLLRLQLANMQSTRMVFTTWNSSDKHVDDESLHTYAHT